MMEKVREALNACCDACECEDTSECKLRYQFYIPVGEPCGFRLKPELEDEIQQAEEALKAQAELIEQNSALDVRNRELKKSNEIASSQIKYLRAEQERLTRILCGIDELDIDAPSVIEAMEKLTAKRVTWARFDGKIHVWCPHCDYEIFEAELSGVKLEYPKDMEHCCKCGGKLIWEV